MNFPIIKIEQTNNIFYVTSMPANIIHSIAKIKRREQNKEEFVQRERREQKIKEIALYCQDPDAVFPTPIIIGSKQDINISNDGFLTIDESKEIGEILDGQHRILGIERAEKLEDFILPVVLFPNITLTKKAYIFSTINSTQTKVSPTEIYNLFGIMQGKSPYKLCYKLAEMFLNDSSSPFYKKLKMKSKKENDEESLSLGTFTNEILKLVSREPQKDWINIKNTENIEDDEKLPLRKYFRDFAHDLKVEREEESEDVIVMYKILYNYFKAVQISFDEEWNNNEKYILSKTAGFGGLIRLFPKLYKLGKEQKTFKEEFFLQKFNIVKNYLYNNNIILTSEFFPSSGQTQNKIKNLFQKALGLE